MFFFLVVSIVDLVDSRLLSKYVSVRNIEITKWGGVISG